MVKKCAINPYVYPGIKKNLLPKSFNTKNLRITTNELLEIVASQTSVSVSDILSKTRKKQPLLARHIFCGILKLDYQYTYSYIAEIVSRDHTSIIHAVRQFRNRKYLEENFSQYVDNIREKIKYM